MKTHTLRPIGSLAPRWTASPWFALLTGCSVLAALPSTLAAQPVEAGVNAVPTALILFDTSGSMEWLDIQDEYPRCLDDVADYLTLRAGTCTNTPDASAPGGFVSDCPAGMFCDDSVAPARCDFARSRHHAAIEVLTGTITNYFPRCDERDADAGRVDQINATRGQGIRHSIACSAPDSGSAALNAVCYRNPAGTIISPPGFRQEADGLIDLYGSFIQFGFMAFDSFQEPSELASGMFSYGPSAWLSDPGAAAAGGCPNGTNCWNLGARSPAPGVEGATVPPLDPTDDSVLRRLQINQSVQQSVLSTVPYWSTPLGEMLSDALALYAGGETGDYYSWYLANDADAVDGAFDYARGREDLYGTCRDKYVILITDGLPSFSDCVRVGSTASGDPWPVGCEGYPYREPEYYAEQLLDAGIKTYVIGFNIADVDLTGGNPLERLERIAIAGGTSQVYFADGSRELLFQLGDILSQIAEGTPSRARPVSTTRLRTGRLGEYRFEARFEIDAASKYWAGDLQRVAFECEDGALLTEPVVESARALLDARPTTGVNERTFFTAQPRVHTCASAQEGQPGRSPFTVESFQVPGPLSRPLIDPEFGVTDDEVDAACFATQRVTCERLEQGNVGDDFSFSVSNTQLQNACLVDLSLERAAQAPFVFGASTAPRAEVFLRWLRGETFTEMRADGLGDTLDALLPANFRPDGSGLYPRDRLSSLADIYHSSPALVAAPDPRLSEATDFRAFAEANAERPTMLYVGSNDGLLHAFNALTLEEEWAFLPPSFQFRVGEWIGPGHTFMFDGSPQVADLVVDRRLGGTGVDSDWRTVLVSGYREGGRGIVAMDITDPLAPEFLWELDAGLDPQLGLTYGEPALGTILTDQCGAGVTSCERGVAIIPGGLPLPSSASTSRIGRVLYVVDLLTGKVLKRFTHAVGTDGVLAPIPHALSGSVSAYNSFAGSLITRAFVGDSQGNLLRLDLSSPDRDQWRLDMFVRADETLDDTPGATFGEVRYRPTVALDSQFRAVVVYGMGDPDELDDLSTRQNYVVSVTETPIFDGDGVVERYEGKLNWAFELEPFEKMTARPRIFNRRAYFATFVPNQADLCQIGGARLFNVDFIGPDPGEGVVTPVTCDPTKVTCYFTEDPADDETDLVAYWDASTPGEVIPPRSIIYSVDITQAPACFLEETTDDGTRGEFGSNSRISSVEDQPVLLQLATSSYGEATELGAARAAESEVLTIPIAAPQSRAVPSSWTVLFE